MSRPTPRPWCWLPKGPPRMGFGQARIFRLERLDVPVFRERRKTVRLSAGYGEKDFGARDFYASYPSRELTSGLLVDLAPGIDWPSGWGLRALGRFRRHDDRFILIRENPGFYQNHHVKDTWSERLVLLSPPGRTMRWAAGVERTDAVLRSNRLGDHTRAESGVFLYNQIQSKTVGVLSAGVRADTFSRWGTELSPPPYPSTDAPLHGSVSRRALVGLFARLRSQNSITKTLATQEAAR